MIFREMCEEFLRNHEGTWFDGREFAEGLIEEYKDYFEIKRANSKQRNFDLVSQVSAEIKLNRYEDLDPHILFEPNPRRFCYDSSKVRNENTTEVNSNVIKMEDSVCVLKEADLYPILIDYLTKEKGLRCYRIDDRKSRNLNGSGFNKYLHPDVVAVKALDIHWNSKVRECARKSNSNTILYSSYEVKKCAKKGDISEFIIQTIHNSMWANESYLVVKDIDNGARSLLIRETETNGVGLLELNTEKCEDSRMLVHPKLRDSVVWSTVNHLFEENRDFEEFISDVYSYLIIGEWRKLHGSK